MVGVTVDDDEQDDQSRSQPLLTTDPELRMHLMERIDRDRQDQRPQHHPRQKRREDEVAQQHKY